MYLAPGLQSPGTRPSPLWCFRFGPRPWKPLTGWSLPLRWPRGGNTDTVRFLPARGNRRPGFTFSYLSLPPKFVDGSLPAPLIRPVDHVVMHEAGGVDHFWDHRYGSLTWEQIPDGKQVRPSQGWSQTTRNSSKSLWHPGYGIMVWSHAWPASI